MENTFRNIGLVALLFLSVQSFGQGFTKLQLYQGINTNIRNKSASQKRLADMLDSLVASMDIGGGGGSYTFSNGLTNTANTITLGGTLVDDVVFNGDDLFGFEFDNLDRFYAKAENEVRIASNVQTNIYGNSVRLGYGPLSAINPTANYFFSDTDGFGFKFGTSNPGDGSLLKFDAIGYAVEIPAGNEGEVLTVSSGQPVWATPSGGFTYAKSKALISKTK